MKASWNSWISYFSLLKSYLLEQKKPIRLSEVTLAIVHVLYGIVQLDASSNQAVLENHRDHFQVSEQVRFRWMKDTFSDIQICASNTVFD